MLEGMQIMTMTMEAFNNMLLKETSCNYDNCGLLSRYVLGLRAEGMPKEVELDHCKCFESRLD